MYCGSTDNGLISVRLNLLFAVVTLFFFFFFLFSSLLYFYSQTTRTKMFFGTAFLYAMFFGNYLQSLCTYICAKRAWSTAKLQLSIGICWRTVCNKIYRAGLTVFLLLFRCEKREPVRFLGRIAAQKHFSAFSAVELLGITPIAYLQLWQIFICHFGQKLSRLYKRRLFQTKLYRFFATIVYAIVILAS